MAAETYWSITELDYALFVESDCCCLHELTVPVFRLVQDLSTTTQAPWFADPVSIGNGTLSPFDFGTKSLAHCAKNSDYG